MTANAHHFGMLLVPRNQNGHSLGGMVPYNAVNFGNKRTGGIKQLYAKPLSLLVYRCRHAV